MEKINGATDGDVCNGGAGRLEDDRRLLAPSPT
jgi:hypothetical protein